MKKLTLLYLSLLISACGGGADVEKGHTVSQTAAKSYASSVPSALAIPGERRAYEISPFEEGLKGISKTGALPDFKLPGLEVRLPDVSLSFDANGAPGQLFRLYKAAFGRTPDAAGLGFWKYAMEKNGVSIEHIGAEFLDSAESKLIYGIQSDNAAFLTRLYKNVLGRAPDADGFAFWNKALLDGVKRSHILLEFANSPENKAGAAALISKGIAFAEPGIAYIPVSNAQGPTDSPVGATVLLEGSISTDANGDPLSFLWSVTSRPTGSFASFASQSVANPRITLDIPGTYQFTLWASDASARSFSPALVTVVAHAAIADTGDYLCYQLDPLQASQLYAKGHRYLDRNNDGKPCTTEDIAYEKSPLVATIADNGIYKCSTISHNFAVLLYLQGHTYLDRDHDGKPCEATDITVETRVTTPPAPTNPGGMCWVNGYYRSNGTYVHGYWRRCPG